MSSAVSMPSRVIIRSVKAKTPQKASAALPALARASRRLSMSRLQPRGATRFM